MPKILHINCSCFGSTGKIIGDIAEHTVELSYEHILCAPGMMGSNPNVRYIRTSLPYEQGVYRRLCSFTGLQYGFAPLSTHKILRTLKKEKPDLVHIHCVNGFMVNVYKLFAFIKKNQIPVVITNHAEFFYTGSCPHAYDCEKWKNGCGLCPQGFSATMSKILDTSAVAHQKMKRALEGLEHAVMVSVSPWVGSRAAISPITAQLPQKVVLNGVNTKVFYSRSTQEFRKKQCIGAHTKVIFHPTANFSAAEGDSKGGRFILQLAERFKEQDYLFIVAGNYSEDLQVPTNVRLLDRVFDQELLAKYYAMADVTVVTGRRETFSMPVAESLCCGTPVVGFFAGGPESIAIDEYCHFCEYGDVNSLVESIFKMIGKQWDKAEIAQRAKNNYDASVMAMGYKAVYKQLLMSKEMSEN